MTTQEFSAGCIKTTSQQKKDHATASLKYNYTQLIFRNAFPKELLEQIGAVMPPNEELSVP